MILHKDLQFWIIGDELTRLDFSRSVLQMLQNNLQVYYFAFSHTRQVTLHNFKNVIENKIKLNEIRWYHKSKTWLTYSSDV